MESAIAVERLRKTYGDVVAVDDLTFIGGASVISDRYFRWD